MANTHSTIRVWGDVCLLKQIRFADFSFGLLLNYQANGKPCEDYNIGVTLKSNSSRTSTLYQRILWRITTYEFKWIYIFAYCFARYQLNKK